MRHQPHKRRNILRTLMPSVVHEPARRPDMRSGGHAVEHLSHVLVRRIEPSFVVRRVEDDQHPIVNLPRSAGWPARALGGSLIQRSSSDKTCRVHDFDIVFLTSVRASSIRSGRSSQTARARVVWPMTSSLWSIPTTPFQTRSGIRLLERFEALLNKRLLNVRQLA